MLAGRCTRLSSTHFLCRSASHWDKISKTIGPIPLSPPALNFGRDFDGESTVKDTFLDRPPRPSEQVSPQQLAAPDKEDGYKHLSDLLQQLQVAKKALKTLKRKKSASKRLRVTTDTVQALQAAGIDIANGIYPHLYHHYIPS